MWMAILMLLLTGLLMAFLSKRFPIANTVAGIILSVFLIGMFLQLQGINVVADLVAKIPYLEYALVLPVGVMLGGSLGKYLPF